MADFAVTGDRAGAARARRFRPLATLCEAFAAEADRLVLWLPVFFATGIAVYFALTVEPPLWLGIAATAAAVIGTVLAWGRPVPRRVMVALGFAVAGFAMVQETRWEHGTPMLDHRISSTAITGTVLDIDTLDRGWRVVVAPETIAGLAASDTPRRVRIHIAPHSDPLRPGDRVSLKGRLYPAPPQVIPGGRDMQRELYFAGIGAVGYSFGPAHRVAGPAARRLAANGCCGCVPR